MMEWPEWTPEEWRRQVAAMKATEPLTIDTLIAKYNAAQPRVPAGSSEGGQWSEGSGGFSQHFTTPTKKPKEAEGRWTDGGNSSLSPSAAAEKYEDYAFASVVNALSEGANPGTIDAGGNKITPAYLEEARAVEQSLQISASKNRSKYNELWRGILLEKGTDVTSLFRKGKVTTLSRLTSASPDREGAEKYTDDQFSGGEPVERVLLRFSSQDGMRGYDSSAYPETILPRGQTFRSYGVKRQGDFWIVELYASRKALKEPLVKLFADLFKYNPNQPRVPAGSEAGGQWAASGAHASVAILPESLRGKIAAAVQSGNISDFPHEPPNPQEAAARAERNYLDAARKVLSASGYQLPSSEDPRFVQYGIDGWLSAKLEISAEAATGLVAADKFFRIRQNNLDFAIDQPPDSDYVKSVFDLNTNTRATLERLVSHYGERVDYWMSQAYRDEDESTVGNGSLPFPGTAGFVSPEDVSAYMAVNWNVQVHAALLDNNESYDNFYSAVEAMDEILRDHRDLGDIPREQLTPTFREEQPGKAFAPGHLLEPILEVRWALPTNYQGDAWGLFEPNGARRNNVSTRDAVTINLLDFDEAKMRSASNLQIAGTERPFHPDMPFARPDSALRSVVAHELAHWLNFRKIERIGGIVYDGMAEVVNSQDRDKAWRSWTTPDLDRVGGTFTAVQFARKYVSGYAAKNPLEFVAEYYIMRRFNPDPPDPRAEELYKSLFGPRIPSRLLKQRAS